MSSVRIIPFVMVLFVLSVVLTLMVPTLHPVIAAMIVGLGGMGFGAILGDAPAAPVTAWVIKTPHGTLLMSTVRSKQEDVIREFRPSETWDYHSKQGYECAQVLVQEVASQ